MGLIAPSRTGGGGRRYSARDVDLLRTIAELTASGAGIEGVRRILELEHQVDALRARNEELGAELEATRQALREALNERAEPPHGRARPAGCPSSASPTRRARWSSGGAAAARRRPTAHGTTRSRRGASGRSVEWPHPEQPSAKRAITSP